MTPTYLAQWRLNPVREVLAGAVATFALIPEVIAFSFAAGVDPAVGLYASFVISILIAIFGGRPAMISAAAGSVALVVAPLVREHGVEYLFAAGLLAGLFQIVFGYARLSRLMRYVLAPVRTGFVNALAILIFLAQVPHILNAGVLGYVLMALTLLMIYALPKLTQKIPAPLIAIVLLTMLSSVLGLDVATVSSLGALPQSLPIFALPEVTFGLDLLKIILLPALAIAVVGLLESLMTARLVDDMTGSTSNPDAEARGLGIANVGASLFGGIAGCGMIGQTVSNVKYGGRGRLSTAFAGIFLLALMLLLKPFVAAIPVAVLVGIMVMVSADTFDWKSFQKARFLDLPNMLVMLVTVIVTVWSHNLALGVLAGVVLSFVVGSAAKRVK